MSTAASQLRFSSPSQLGPLVVMGVSGCGKTSVGKMLASSLGYAFIEGDSRHSEANIQKMRSGTALTDDDRLPWLTALGQDIATDQATVVSCSSLKRSYRDILRSEAGVPLIFVFLQGDRTTLAARLSMRKGHFMPLNLLDSQLQTLELPTHERDVVTVEIDQSIERIVSIAIARVTAVAHRRETLTA